MIHEVGAMTPAFLSTDFLEQGGPGTIPAGDPIILEAARTVSVAQALVALVGQTALGFGIASFGTLIAWAPAGRRNPPRWLGVAGLLGGLGMICTWVFLLDHTAGGVITGIAELAIIVFVRPSRGVVPASTRPVGNGHRCRHGNHAGRRVRWRAAPQT